MIRLAIGAGLLASIVVLSGCDDPKYGEKLLRFAEERSRALSERHARAELRERWVAGHRVQALDLLARLETSGERLGIVVTAARQSPERNAAELGRINTAIIEVIRVKRDLEQARTALRDWSEACDSRSLFERTELARAGTALPIPVVEVPEDRLLGASSDLTLLIRSLTSQIEANRIREQNAKAREALAIFRARAVQGDELFEFSRQVCRDARREADRVARAVADTLATLESAQASARVALEQRRADVEFELAARLSADGEDAARAADQRRQVRDEIESARNRAAQALSGGDES
jgi:hypothetical protein